MLAIGRTLLWEQWRLSRRRFVSLGAGVFGLSWLLLTFSSPDTQAASRSLLWALLMMQILLTVLLLLQARDPAARAGFGEYFYRLPVMTRALVFWRLLGLIVAAGLSGSALIAYARYGHGLDWPMGPAILANAVAVSLGAAVYWTLVSSLTLGVVIAGFLIFAFAGWLAALVGMDLGLSFGDLSIVWLAQGVGILAMGAAWWLATWGVARDRRGSAVNLDLAIRQLVDRWSLGRSAVVPEFSSPALAQYWMEWRQKGHFLPLHTSAVLGFVFLFHISGGSDTAETLKMLGIFFAFIGGTLPPSVGILVGRFSSSTETPELDPFRATRPLGDRTLALIFLAFGGANLLVSYSILIFGSLVILGFLWAFGDRALIEMLWFSVAPQIEAIGWPALGLLLIAALLSAWACMGLAASLSLTGRNSVGAVLILSTYGVLAAFIWLYKTERLEQLVHYGSSLAWILGILAMLGTAAAFIAGRRRQLLPKSWPWIALGCWAGTVLLGAVGAEVGIAELSSGLERSLMVLGIGVLALVTAPPAIAPLALSWNRHR